MPRDAILFYAQMKECAHYTLCDNYTYSSALKACAATRNLRVGKAVHCYFVRGLLNPSRIVYNCLLIMYSTCLSSVVDSEIGGCGYSDFDYRKRYAEAIRQFRMIMMKGIRPSTVSFVNVFPALSSLEDYKNGKIQKNSHPSMMEQMLHGLQNSTRAYSRSSASSSAMGQHDHGVAREVDAIYRLLPVCASVPLRD
ncbi:hypothetical protein Patl1_33078 [Pistacia atlantica]|uniref:Uncharacterized protein n=1 Tax=Pistacia atlantica TaxID=434234 RepID=A0ACC1AND2_9ROSI|nr:hypothetical protein Patl1_33078 [Pistacia atlantica]